MLVPIAGVSGGASVMVERQVNKFRWKRKAEKRNRRLHQVFLRGDNIVTIKPVLQDVQKHWSQLVLQWASAGIPTAAFMFQTQAGEPNQTLSLPLPPAPSHSAAVAHLTPAWAHNRR